MKIFPDRGIFHTNESEIYTPSTQIWAPTGSMLDARSFFQMVVLPNSDALAGGGQIDTVGSNDLYGVRSETYNYISRQWTNAGYMFYDHSDFQMLLL